MIKSSIVLVKGISGSGKSTRVFLFLEYLKKIGVQIDPFFITSCDDKIKQIGVIARELNLIFVGKYYTDGGVSRWQGLDSVTSRLEDSSGLSEFIEKCAERGYNLLIEGAGTTATWRLRPKDLIENRNIKNILLVRYDYADDEKDKYHERIKYRSGKNPNSDSMWDKSHNFMNDFKKSIQESDGFSVCQNTILLHDLSYTSPTFDLGCNILSFFDCEDMCGGFMEFCESSNYVKINSFENFENGKDGK